MSRAVVFDRYGEPEVLHVVDSAAAAPQSGQVRIVVKAAGVQPFDCMFRSGAAHEWMPASFPQRVGNEFAGVIDAIGEGVTDCSSGDEVIGWTSWPSAYAEHVVVEEGQYVAKPEGMPWAEAGALSASGQTAATALDDLTIVPGDTLLIHGATGGVGTFTVQLAKALGATVIGTARQTNHNHLQSLGAIPVVYGDGIVERVREVAPKGVDAALDLSGTVAALDASVELVSDRARVATTVWQPAADQLGIRRVSTRRSVEQLARLASMYRTGQLRVVIQQTYPLKRAAEAHLAMETGHVRGKVVLVT